MLKDERKQHAQNMLQACAVADDKWRYVICDGWRLESYVTDTGGGFCSKGDGLHQPVWQTTTFRTLSGRAGK